MRCSKHPEHEAAGVCTYSGKPYCADELVEVSGKVYAKDNLSNVFSEMKEQATKPAAAPMVFMNAGGAASSAASSAAAVSNGYGTSVYRRRSRAVTFMLAVCLLFGLGGLHRLYTGDTVIGIVQLLTFGGFFIWQIIDLLAIVSGTYRDAQGHLLG